MGVLNLLASRLGRRAPEASPVPQEARAATSTRAPSTWDLLRATGGALPGSHATPDLVLSASSVATRCVSLRSELLASMPLRVYRRTPDGGRQIAEDVPLNDVLQDQASDLANAFEAREFLIRSLDLRGNGYAAVGRDRAGQVVELEALHPDLVSVEVISAPVSQFGPTSSLPRRRLRYIYSPPEGGSVRFTQDEVLHIRGPSRDGIRGLSPLDIARENLGLMLNQTEAASNLAGQGLRSSGFLETGQVLDEPDRERLQAIMGRYMGAQHAGGLMILEGGMAYKPISWSPENAELLASRKLSNEDVARLFGCPPSSVGITDKATYNGVEAELTALVRNALAPLASRVEAAMSRCLLSRAARRTLWVEHDLSGLLRGDTTARYTAYATGRQWGWLSANEIRRFENQPPIQDGDRYLEPLNMTPAGGAATTIQPASA